MSSGDIKGHDSAIEILEANVKGGRIFSAYIFTGADAGAMLLAARNFAKAVNCLSEKGDICESCVPCRKINSQNHPDIFLAEPGGASSSIGIDQIRDAIRWAALKPYEAKKKIFIINEAHSMNQAASNAFLRTLEEPPLDTIFILISRSEKLLLSTIVSRCQVIKFSAAPAIGTFPEGNIGKSAALKGEKKETLRKRLDVLLVFLRDIFLYKAIGREEAIFYRDRIDEVKARSAEYDAGELDRLMKKLITLRSYLDYNVNPKIIDDVADSETNKLKI